MISNPNKLLYHYDALFKQEYKIHIHYYTSKNSSTFSSQNLNMFSKQNVLEIDKEYHICANNSSSVCKVTVNRKHQYTGG